MCNLITRMIRYNAVVVPHFPSACQRACFSFGAVWGQKPPASIYSPLEVLVIEVHDDLLARGHLRQELVLRNIAELRRDGTGNK